MTRATVFAALALPVALAGCDFAPKYARPAGAAPASFPRGGVYPPAATDAPDVTRVGWRDFFTDPRLQAVIATALDNNRDLRIAAGNVLQARAQYRVQRADRVPTVSLSGSVTYTNSVVGASGATAGGTTGSGTGTGGTTGGTGTGSTVGGTSNSDFAFYSLNVGVSAYEADLFGRVRNLARAAQQQLFASEEAQRSARIALIAEVATAWLTMASDGEQLRISRATLTAFAETLRLTRAQFRIGVASELEARQAETNYQAARSDIAALETQVTQDQNALNLLVGTTVVREQLPTGMGAEPVSRDALPPDLSSAVLLRRPDVLEAEHRLIAEYANIGAARAAFFPTISLTASLGTISTALTGLFSGGSFTYTGAPSIGLPLLDGGRRRGNLDYARASREVALATYERAVQTAFREVADALAARGRIGERIAAQQARAEAARVAARLSDARYRAGVDSFLVALDAQRTAYAAEQQLATTRLTRASNLVELYRALGGGLGPAPDSNPLHTAEMGVTSPKN